MYPTRLICSSTGPEQTPRIIVRRTRKKLGGWTWIPCLRLQYVAASLWNSIRHTELVCLLRAAFSRRLPCLSLRKAIPVGLVSNSLRVMCLRSWQKVRCVRYWGPVVARRGQTPLIVSGLASLELGVGDSRYASASELHNRFQEKNTPPILPIPTSGPSLRRLYYSTAISAIS